MENASDFIGGVPLDHQNSDLNAIIIDLVQTHNLNSSLKFAGLTINEISKINMLHTEKPQQAKFAVLKAPDVPSILIEIDFISNPAREKKMKTRLFQDAFACNIVNAAQKFLSATKGEPLKPKSIYHYVKKGETLSSIAKQYKTSVNTLRKLNGMSTKSVLRYGDKIRVL
jgi:N-acetylmuramoyl-L-alanine amidase